MRRRAARSTPALCFKSTLLFLLHGRAVMGHYNYYFWKNVYLGFTLLLKNVLFGFRKNAQNNTHLFLINLIIRMTKFHIPKFKVLNKKPFIAFCKMFKQYNRSIKNTLQNQKLSELYWHPMYSMSSYTFAFLFSVILYYLLIPWCCPFCTTASLWWGPLPNQNHLYCCYSCWCGRSGVKAAEKEPVLPAAAGSAKCDLLGGLFWWGWMLI